MAVSFDTVLKLNLLSPATLDAMEIIPTTRYSKNNKNFRNPTHIKCPLCGSLEMTPKFDQGRATQWFCSCYGHGNRSLTNLELFMKINGIDDRDEAARRFCEIAHIEFKTEDDDSDAPKQLSPEEIKTLILDEIDIAKTSFDKLPDIDKRGFEIEDFQRVDIGIDLHWTHPKMPNTPETPRFIVPLGDKGNYVSYNAILTPEGRKKFKAVRESKNPPKWSDKCLTAGAKLVFNPPALEEKIVPTTEGEFDALAIMKAYEYRTLACALGGAGQWRDLCSRLEKCPTKPFILLIKDEDDGGDKGMNKVAQHLAEIRVPAVVRSLEQYMSAEDISKVQGVANKVDANAVMQTLGLKFLRNLMTEIIVDVDDELNALADKYAVAEKTKPAELPFEPYYSKKKSSPSSENRRPEIQELLDKINTQITPEKLEKENILTHSANGRPRPEGYCCPWCGSGTHTKKTGSLQFYPNGRGVYCHSCSEGGNVFQLINFVRHEDTSGQNFFVQLRRIADEFGVDYDPTIFERKENKKLTVQSVAQEKIDAWCDVNGGAVAPEISDALAEAEKFFADITPEKITPELVRSSVTVQNLALATFYDFMSDAVDKFFDAFDTAKSTAAEQIANAKAGLTEKPSPTTLAVARLNRREISNNIGRKVTELRKAHKKFIADLESKKLREDYQAREQKQREANQAALGKAYKLTPEQAAHLLAQDDDDYGRATQFAFLNDNRIRYISSREQWLIFERNPDFPKCGIWKLGNPTRNTIVMPLAADVHKYLLANAPDNPEATFKSNVKNWRNLKCMNNAVRLAGTSTTRIQITPQDLDRHPNLILCKNGVVDLQTKKFYEDVDPKKYMSKQANVIFDPKADPEFVWEVLRAILPDNATLAATLRYMGYSMTADVSQQKIHFWEGEGANGKSTLLATFLHLLGSYGIKISSELIAESIRPTDANTATPALASLIGVRAAISSELRDNARLNAQMVKDLASGEMLPVRLLHCNAETFKPTCKLIICGNFFPRIGNVNDKGLRRRIQTVRFNKIFEGDNADPQLPEKLLERNNLSALFNILIESTYQFYRAGKLLESADMVSTRESYFDENDIVANFVDEYCVVDADKHVLRKDLIEKFKDVYRSDAARLKNHFEAILKKRYTIYPHKTNKGIEFRGIGLIDEPPAGAPVKKSNGSSLDNLPDFPEDMAPPDM